MVWCVHVCMVLDLATSRVHMFHIMFSTHASIQEPEDRAGEWGESPNVWYRAPTWEVHVYV